MYMRNTLTCLTAALLLIQGCASNKTENKYVLKGQLAGIPDGMVKLQRMDQAERKSITIDSIQIQNGKFTMEGDLNAPEMMTLMIEPGNWSASFFVEPGNLQFEADTTGATHYDYTAYEGIKGAVLTKFGVTGSQNQAIYNAFENHPKNIAAKEVYAALNKKYEAEPNPASKEAIRGEMSAFGEQQKVWELQCIDSLIQAHPSSVAVAYLLQRYQQFNESIPVSDLEKRVAGLSAPAKESAYVKELQDIIAIKKALLPGQETPNFKALKTDSSEFTLSSLRGQYVLLDFWASWCVPCRKAIPHWKEVYSQYHDKGLEIVGVTNDSRWPDWFKALDMEKMPWLQVADDFPVKNRPARIATLYDIPSLPTYVLLDKEGKIVVHTTSKEDVDAELKRIFN